MTTATVTEEQVVDALREIYDPEIPIINIVDLGLIYEVEVHDSEVNVEMSLTAQGCPMSGTISATCEEAIEAIPGVGNATVDVVWDPPWSPEKITEEGRKALGWE
jgi:metal-sulfur cluster biosynthetic enzyme